MDPAGPLTSGEESRARGAASLSPPAAVGTACRHSLAWVTLPDTLPEEVAELRKGPWGPRTPSRVSHPPACLFPLSKHFPGCAARPALVPLQQQGLEGQRQDESLPGDVPQTLQPPWGLALLKPPACHLSLARL